MDVRQLRYFLSVAKCRSFSRAAVDLNVAQPALSHHVANLEAELGVKLFERSTKGVKPTECGETLMRHAETIIRQVNQAAIDVKTTSAHPSGIVTIGLPTSISISLTVPLLQAVEARFPAISLRINENHSGYLSEWVLAGRLDMAVLFDIDSDAPLRLDPAAGGTTLFRRRPRKLHRGALVDRAAGTARQPPRAHRIEPRPSPRHRPLFRLFVSRHRGKDRNRTRWWPSSSSSPRAMARASCRGARSSRNARPGSCSPCRSKSRALSARSISPRPGAGLGRAPPRSFRS